MYDQPLLLTTSITTTTNIYQVLKKLPNKVILNLAVLLALQNKYLTYKGRG